MVETSGIGLSRGGCGEISRDVVSVWRTGFLAAGSMKNANFLSQLNSGGN